MNVRTNTFTKVILLIVLLLIPIIMLYALSHRVSVSVLQEEIQSLRQKDMTFLANEVHNSVDNLSTMAYLLSDDIHIQELQHLPLLENAYERNREKLRLLERLRLLNVTERWDTQYSVFSPQTGDIVSTNPTAVFDLEEVKRILSPSWTFRPMKFGNMDAHRFVRHFVKPQSATYRPEDAGIVIEVSFPSEYLVKELDNFKTGGSGDPFFYQQEGVLITSRSADSEMIVKLAERLDEKNMQRFTNEVVTIGGNRYLLTAAPIPSLQLFLVDYVPMESIIQPINRTRNLFYGSIALMLVMGLLASYLLYRNVQRPISLLIRNVQRLKRGDYSARINVDPNNEFTFLFRSFNDMASEIEQLIEKVYVEEIRSREASLKQLQSQINPHFLYNCFALIRSLSRLGKHDSVRDLSMHLSKYYRYTTRMEKTSASLQEELELIESYMQIQKYHLQHLSYRIDIPEELRQLEVPRLLLQPIVENAIVHGLEQYEGDASVTIRSECDDRYHILVVEDNGLGMTDLQLEKVKRDINTPPNEESGCALWNIQQRLHLQFGEDAGLSFERREAGGTVVRIKWRKQRLAG